MLQATLLFIKSVFFGSSVQQVVLCQFLKNYLLSSIKTSAEFTIHSSHCVTYPFISLTMDMTLKYFDTVVIRLNTCRRSLQLKNSYMMYNFVCFDHSVR